MLKKASEMPSLVTRRRSRNKPEMHRCSHWHLENAEFPMNESLEPDSNVTAESEEQFSKQCSAIISREEGMQIDHSAEQQENALGPMNEGAERDSNVTVRSDEHSWKPCSPSGSSVEGT
jgi:hypothetical protein